MAEEARAEEEASEDGAVLEEVEADLGEARGAADSEEAVVEVSGEARGEAEASGRGAKMVIQLGPGLFVEGGC